MTDTDYGIALAVIVVLFAIAPITIIPILWFTLIIKALKEDRK